jgi:transcriptional antiterminator RfaH
MPILNAEPCVHPEGLFADVTLSTAAGQRWWVLHTHSRVEKQLARVALTEDIPFFLPLYLHRWRKNGRVFKSRLPLFPGYLFIHAHAGQHGKFKDTRAVAQVLPVHDQERLYADLQRVYQLMTTGAPMLPEARLPTGARVRIHDGPFRGYEGTLLKRGNQLRLLIAVDFMRQGVSVEVESWMVSPVSA